MLLSKVSHFYRQPEPVSDLEKCVKITQYALRTDLFTSLVLACMGPMIAFYGFCFMIFSKSPAIIAIGAVLTIISGIIIYFCLSLRRNRGKMINDRDRLIRMYRQQCANNPK